MQQSRCQVAYRAWQRLCDLPLLLLRGDFAGAALKIDYREECTKDENFPQLWRKWQATLTPKEQLKEAEWSVNL